MKIAIVAPGRRPIPPTDYGAVEILIHNYTQRLQKAGHTIEIYNSIWINEVTYELNRKHYDFIHLHFDVYAGFLNKHLQKPYCLTSHCSGFTKFVPGNYDYYPAFNYLFSDSLEAPGNIVLSKDIEKLYAGSGYKKFLATLRNPVETEKFRFAKQGNGKALCIGVIVPRKRQAFLAKILKGKVAIDFVGPYFSSEEPNFKENETCKYIGIWNKKVLYESLTNYSCLVLMSKSEADPLVVKEALAAGLSVVVNKASSTNLTNEKFITILPDVEENPEVIRSAIQKAIDENKLYRKEIRDYTSQRFDYSILIKEYLRIIEEFREYYK